MGIEMRMLPRLAGFALGMTIAVSAQSGDDALRQRFLNPPDDARPLMRWWWFGPSVTKPELAKELETMRSAGIGGVEIQPVYPMALDDASKGIRNLRYLSPEFLDAVGFANRTARSLGMRVDITLGSGWPYGGPGTTPGLAAGKLRVAAVPIPDGRASDGRVAAPPLKEGESLIAAFAIGGTEESFDAATAQRIENGEVPPGQGTRTALYFIASHTGMQVKRAAFGAEGNVLDHFSRAAIDEHLNDIAKPLLGAFGDEPPYSVFSDSLEVEESDWTPDLPAEFLKRRGYDLIPHLPELLAGGTEQAAEVRHDWGKTLAELVRENYLAPITQFAEAHHTLFRSQTYGDPAVTEADEATPNLIEGEGMQWRKFSYCRWATSAGHLYGRNVLSAETWTWLHSPAFRATPLDVKAEADRMFLLGVNQFVGHGWPYSPAAAGEPGWAFYAAAVFNAHNPWFAVMPEITKYLSRVSWLLRQGKPANDAAILLPEDDAQAAFAPGHVSVTDEMSRRITPQLMAEILDAGYNVDYIDAATIDKLGTIPYPVLVIPPTERIPLATYKKIEAYAAGSGKVIAVGKTPSLAPGLMESGDSKEIAAISERLFRGRGQRGMFSENDRWVMSQLRYRQFGDSYRSLYVKATERSAIGFICRKLPDRDIYFVANTSNHSVHAYLAFGSPHLAVQEWDPETGDVIRNGRIEVRFTNGETTHLRSDPPGISADFAPYQSRVFLMSDGSKPLPVLNAAAPPPHIETIEDLNSGWKIRFNDEKAERDLPQVNSWTELSGRQFYSGEATYTRSFTLDEVPHGSLLLDFGDGKAIADDRPPEADGMHALLDPPIREAAIIFVNGKRAGALWHPPYRLDISQFVKKGANQIEIRVYNTALNELAGQPPRDLTALRAKYGTRFEPQDMDRVKPIASGLLGPVWLEILPVQ